MDEFAGLTTIVFRVRVDGVAETGGEDGAEDVPPPPHPARASTIPTIISTPGWVLTRSFIPRSLFFSSKLVGVGNASTATDPALPRRPTFLYRVTAFHPRCMAAKIRSPTFAHKELSQNHLESPDPRPQLV